MAENKLSPGGTHEAPGTPQPTVAAEPQKLPGASGIPATQGPSQPLHQHTQNAQSQQSQNAKLAAQIQQYYMQHGCVPPQFAAYQQQMMMQQMQQQMSPQQQQQLQALQLQQQQRMQQQASASSQAQQGSLTPATPSAPAQPGKQQPVNPQLPLSPMTPQMLQQLLIQKQQTSQQQQSGSQVRPPTDTLTMPPGPAGSLPQHPPQAHLHQHVHQQFAQQQLAHQQMMQHQLMQQHMMQQQRLLMVQQQKGPPMSWGASLPTPTLPPTKKQRSTRRPPKPSSEYDSNDDEASDSGSEEASAPSRSNTQITKTKTFPTSVPSANRPLLPPASLLSCGAQLPARPVMPTLTTPTLSAACPPKQEQVPLEAEQAVLPVMPTLASPVMPSAASEPKQPQIPVKEETGVTDSADSAAASGAHAGESELPPRTPVSRIPTPPLQPATQLLASLPSPPSRPMPPPQVVAQPVTTRALPATMASAGVARVPMKATSAAAGRKPPPQQQSYSEGSGSEYDSGADEDIPATFSCGSCNQVDTDEMVQCDGCRKWYHFVCQDFDPRTPESAKWYCENCDFFRDPLNYAERQPGNKRGRNAKGKRKRDEDD